MALKVSLTLKCTFPEAIHLWKLFFPHPLAQKPLKAEIWHVGMHRRFKHLFQIMSEESVALALGPSNRAKLIIPIT